MLEDAGYKDTDGDGIREMPGGGQPLNFTYYVRSDGETGPEIAEFVTGWLREIGIATTKKVADDSQLTTIIGKGDYDMFAWGWTPFVDPDPMLSYFTCDQVVERSRGPDELLQRRELLRSGVRQALPAAEGRARPGQARGDRPRDAHALPAVGHVPRALHGARDQAYVKGRFDGFVRQPAKIGPMLYSNTSPSYAQLKPASASAAAAMTTAAAAARSSRSSPWSQSRAARPCAAAAPPHRCTSASERPLRRRQGPWVPGDPGLRRLLQLLPVPGRRGRPGGEPLPRPEPDGEPARRADEAVRARQVEGRAVRLLPGADRAAEPGPLLHEQPASLGRDQAQGGADDRAGRDLGDPVRGLRNVAGHSRRLAKTHAHRLLDHRVLDRHLLDARLLARHAPAHAVRGDPRLVPGRRDRGPDLDGDRRRASWPTRPSTCSCRRSRSRSPISASTRS